MATSRKRSEDQARSTPAPTIGAASVAPTRGARAWGVALIRQRAASLASCSRRIRTRLENPWLMRVKAAFAGPEQVLRYLGRYTHRTAISNPRILAFEKSQVTFAYRDRRHGNALKHMRLDADTFARRFLLHVLPKRFVRIRHFGILANPLKARLLPLCRRLLGAGRLEGPAKPRPWYELVESFTGIDRRRCSRCRQGHYVKLCDLPRDPLGLAARSRSPP